MALGTPHRVIPYMHLNELKALHVSEVLKQAEELEIENTGRMRKQELMFAIIRSAPRRASRCLPTGCWRSCPTVSAFCAAPTPATPPARRHLHQPSQVRRFNLHTGDMIEGEVRIPKDGERYFALTKLDTVNGGPSRTSTR